MLKTVTNLVDASQIITPITLPGDVTLSTGNLVIGTAGKGIDFSATPGTGTSELFNDYEEGTWLPTLTASTSGTITVNSATSTCWYIKVGRVVHFGGRINVSAISSPTGELNLGGFPFSSATVASGQNQISFSVVFNNLATALSGAISFFWTEGTTACRLRDGGNSTGSGGAIANKVGGTTQIYISGSYLAV
jgi:hypothetical protein